jgi:hypothetical protein
MFGPAQLCVCYQFDRPVGEAGHYFSPLITFMRKGGKDPDPAGLCVCFQVDGPVGEAGRGARHQPADPGGRGVELTPPTAHQDSPLRPVTSPG